MRKEIVFLGKFFAIYLILQAVIQLAPLQPLQEAIAGVEAGVLGLESLGNRIETSSGAFIINASCTGLVSASVLAAVIFALRKPDLKTKLLMFVIGAIALFLLNLLRVYLVLLVGINYGAGEADLTHTVSWFSTAALILAAWYVAVRKIAKIENFSELM